MTLKKKPFEDIVGQGENAGNQHFLIFLQFFLRIPKRIYVFSLHFVVVCKCFEFEPVFEIVLTLYQTTAFYDWSKFKEFGNKNLCKKHVL